MNHNIDDEIIRSCFGDCLFLFYSDTKNNNKVIRMMDDDLKVAWDKILSDTDDYYKTVLRIMEDRVHPDDRQIVRDIFDYDKYTVLMKDRKYYSDYFRYKKDPSSDTYIYEKLSISKLTDSEDGTDILVFSSNDVDESFRKKMREAEAKKQYYSVTYALGREYSSIYYVDMDSGKVTPYNVSNRIEGMFGDTFYKADYDKAVSTYIDKAVKESDKEMMRKVLSRKFVLSQISGLDHFTWIYQNNEGNYCELKCVRVSDVGEPVAVVMGFAVKDAEIRVEMEEKAQTDFQLSLLDGLSRDYEMVWLLRKDKKMRLFRVCDNPEVQRVALQYYDCPDYDIGFNSFIDRYVAEEDRDRLKEFTRYENLSANVPAEGMYSTVFKRNIPGGYVYIQLCFTRAVGPDGEENIVCACRDVDALIREENKRREMYSKAIKERDLDGLTGIRNRYCFEHIIQRMEKGEIKDLSVVYIDADFLHELNNSEGHDAGDELIRFIANSLVKLWGVDNTFRIGGDEFIAFDSDIDENSCLEKISVLKQKAADRKYSISVGYSHIGDSGTNIQELITSAEKMMYEEKKKHHENAGQKLR